MNQFFLLIFKPFIAQPNVTRKLHKQQNIPFQQDKRQRDNTNLVATVLETKSLANADKPRIKQYVQLVLEMFAQSF